MLVLIASLFDDPVTMLHDFPVGGDRDVTVALGSRWSEVVGGAKWVKRIADVVAKYPKIQKYAKPEQLENLAAFIKDAYRNETLGTKTDSSMPQVQVHSLPIGASLEFCVGVSWGYCRVYDYKDTTGIVWTRRGRRVRTLRGWRDWSQSGRARLASSE